jgi:LmbE family N-acetylglucosaminyl deacetylase
MMDPMNPSKTVLLALFAHPDDESYRAGGLLALLAQNGVRVHTVTATRGEAGASGSSGINTSEPLSVIREKELHCACQALNLQPPVVWDFPDGRLAEIDPEIIIQRVLPLMHEIQPQVVLSFGPDGLSGHQDHIAIGDIASAVFSRYQKAGALYHLAVPVSVAQSLGMNQIRAVPDCQITLAVDVTSVWEAKMKAIYCHATQVAFSPILSQSEDRQRQFLGAEHFVRAAVSDPNSDFLPSSLRDFLL